ncbi:hypothetical protein [Candidatus Thiosymbion oneisti]|uniref:hypothetical protein n=1 Tax=Candidatus Thiosymbion oneisti TaxID=589554 RepID=UPI000B7F1983|nr:hypothetical protein [Candidatus Thiosymbion oneisti]
MRRRFRCLPLGPPVTHETFEFEEQVREGLKAGLHVFYTHLSHVIDVANQYPTVKQLWSPLDKTSMELDNHWKDEAAREQWRVEPNRWLVVDRTEPGLLDWLARQFYVVFSSQSIFNGPETTVVILHAMAYEIIQRRSPIMHPQFHQYLLWDDAGLWTDGLEEMEKADKLSQCWHGAGWASELSRETGGNGLGLSPRLDQECSEAIGRLAAANRRLMDYLSNPEHQNSPDETAPVDTASYLRTLGDFLPFHWFELDGGRYIPTRVTRAYNLGGPRIWEGLYAIGNLYLRQLILDGWVTPWPHADRLYYQPASLALLYWAARQLGKDYTRDADAFLDNYRWREPANWFGGHWTHEGHPESIKG